MSKRKKKHQEEEGGEAWLLPYSDLMTLLLAVFIVLFAVSQIDSAKSEEMAQAFRGNMMTGGAGMLNRDGQSIVPLYPDAIAGNGEDGKEAEDGGMPPADTGTEEELSPETMEELIAAQDLSNLEQLQSDLQELFDQEGLSAAVTTHIDERGLVVSLDNAILFDSGSADIKPENEAILVAIAADINELDNYIRIEGHTDNRPINTEVYPSNWELSSARAASVVRLFINNPGINPEKMVAVGYGEYKPIGDNNTEAGRAQNRRIDLIVLNTKYNSLEDQITDVETIN